ncbi:MAG: cell division protein FtsI [Candidatus Aquicultor secundus]|uniref:Cell division protein FtsI n=1 Tax=Candidatus Aquicultor secundus TaxID=1973895 RepID=A0A2M7T733_9ACTN|nr:MAG: cell division protein FtsI [Candidatus Aquicultor secundus]PIZ37226.1 MAG: cell division protein FtsI [Candidatus Aquicultor secundus]
MVPVNKRIARLGAVFTALFLLLTVNLTYMQFFAADSLTARPENIRPLLNDKRIKRGDIISADEVVLATTKKSADGYKRSYPKAEIAAPITGFYSHKYGRAGLELTFDEYLSGQTKVSSIDDYIKRLLGREAPGNNITLTINIELQRTAMRALGSKKGAIVALNPKTGAVLALASRPSYDPNEVDSHWAELSKNPDGVMLNRALQGRFTPGSSFKIITAAAALQDNVTTVDKIYDASSTVKIYGGKVTNYEGKSYGKLSFAEAFAKSANTVFAQIGKELGGAKLVDMAKSFGFADKIPFDLPTAQSRIPAASQMDDLEVAWAAVGQGRIQATPLTMALAGAAVANNGTIMQPYVVENIREHDGNTVYEHRPSTWQTPMSQTTAETIKSLMEKVVSEGTGKAARIDGVQVAGKTGTAEVGQKKPHAWFVGFAPADNPQVAVAVIIENGGVGGSVAAPIAREIILSALGKQR